MAQNAELTPAITTPDAAVAKGDDGRHAVVGVRQRRLQGGGERRDEGEPRRRRG
jgi:hypothetical protein